ncbi:hypothetical protein BLOT_002383 [Blomia tropicalis]|nr:hypothetical protein BLOT_002383 [Blomia tropicalis]
MEVTLTKVVAIGTLVCCLVTCCWSFRYPIAPLKFPIAHGLGGFGGFGIGGGYGKGFYRPFWLRPYPFKYGYTYDIS